MEMIEFEGWRPKRKKERKKERKKDYNLELESNRLKKIELDRDRMTRKER